jgi:DNA polymerase elongation subunit (family B)
MARLVFDIESAALPLDLFDEAQREYLLREAERSKDAVSQAHCQEEIKRRCSLWPLTAQVVCIAMINVDSKHGQVLFLADDCDTGSGSVGDVRYVSCPDESELLASFWGAARHYQQIITFNGRSFDVPFLYLRSALLGVPISRKDWLGYRFQTEPHCDLAEQLSFYGVSGREGAARRFNLDFYCKAFGITSPKSQGVTGMDVGRLMAEGKHREIADYCVRDVEATMELYGIWLERLAGIK